MQMRQQRQRLLERGCSFTDHYAWPSMRELLLQFENLLRKCVDLGVLFVNLLCQSFKLRGLR